ncbi:unnamed protein product [Periconia digitata]|uniref:ABM domain-containing protein n=1 Tax=Periconia digitata TaxID=1303443 RepID=A0A9W4UMC1_9PLEO|nr:unnamed protein product [Periconia digitata]
MMPVLEATQLRLKGVGPEDVALIESLSSVRGILRTQSEFFSYVQDSSLIFILGLWPSLHAHREFLASPHAAAVLGAQEKMLDFESTVHMEFDAP